MVVAKLFLPSFAPQWVSPNLCFENSWKEAAVADEDLVATKELAWALVKEGHL